MVSMCCEDCKNKQLKMNTLNKILVKEQSNYIMNFLGCDEAKKILDIMDDPQYKSIPPENQDLYMLVELFPFPETIKDFKNMTKHYKLPPYFSKSDCREVKSLVNRKTFPMIKYYYNNMYNERENRGQTKIKHREYPSHQNQQHPFLLWGLEPGKLRRM